MLSKIKAEFENIAIAFGRSGKKLGQRDDLDELAIMAHESDNDNLKDLFEILPPLAELKQFATQEKLEGVKPVQPKDVLHGENQLKKNKK